MPITSVDDIAAGNALGSATEFFKPSITAVASNWYTLWRAAGLPAAGGTPTTAGTALTRSSAGALPVGADLGLIQYLSMFEGVGSVAGTLMLCDRIIEWGGLSSAVITAQSVTGHPALPTRATGATDLTLWVDSYVAGGATATGNLSSVYLDQGGASGTTPNIAIAATGWPASRTYQLPFAAGDTGVTDVTSITLQTSSGTAGSIGPVIRRVGPKLRFATANIGQTLDWAMTSLRKFGPDPALELLFLPTTTSTGLISGSVKIIQA